MTRRTGHLALATAALAAGLLGASGCSSNSVSGGLSTLQLTFVPDSTCSGADVVARSGANSNGDLVFVELVVNTSPEVFGAKLTLDQIPTTAQFFGALGGGSFLETACSVSKTACLSASDCPDGESCQPASLIVTPQSPSIETSVPVAITRSGVTTGAIPTHGDTTAAVDEVLITLEFGREAVTVDSSDLTLHDAQLFSPGTPPVAIAGVTFCGGKFMVN